LHAADFDEEKNMAEKQSISVLQVVCIAVGILIGMILVQKVLGLGGIVGGALGGGLGAALGLGIFALVSKRKQG
jgi:hypothetical protein